MIWTTFSALTGAEPPPEGAGGGRVVAGQVAPQGGAEGAGQRGELDGSPAGAVAALRPAGHRRPLVEYAPTGAG